MSDWQPIATMPSDGTPVLVSHRFPWMKESELDLQAVCWRQDNLWSGGLSSVTGFTPTAWMPLPAPPEEP